MKNLLIFAILLLSTFTFAQNFPKSGVTVSKSTVSVPKYNGAMRVTIIYLEKEKDNEFDVIESNLAKNIFSDGDYVNCGFNTKLSMKGKYKIIVVKNGETTIDFFTIK